MSEARLTEEERGELERLFGYVPEPEPFEQMAAAVEAILAARLAKALDGLAEAYRIVARVEALADEWPCSDETCDGDCTGCAYGADLRAALSPAATS